MKCSNATGRYGWAKATGPTQPVLSCWGDSNDTDIPDVHTYDSAFRSKWSAAIFENPAKGAFVTEAGSRWWQGHSQMTDSGSSDSGSPLTVTEDRLRTP